MYEISRELFENSQVYIDKDDENISYQCVIDHQGDEKYILLELLPSSSNDDDDENKSLKKRYVIASTETQSYHSDCRDWYIANTITLHKDKFKRPRCLGGGIITIDNRNKTIKTYGTSGGYGDPVLELVEKILLLAYPNYSHDIQITDYIRQ